MTVEDRGARDGRAWATPGAVLVFALSTTVLIVVFWVFSRQPWSMLDLHVYLWGGSAAEHRSIDPYVHTYLRSGLRFTYTPLAAGIFSLLADMRPHAVSAALTAVSIAALVAVLWLTWGSLQRGDTQHRLRATLAAAAVALWLEPVRQTLSFGQVNLVLMAVVVADLLLADTRWWKGVGVGLAAGFKLTPLIFVPYLILTRRYRAAAVAMITFGVTVGGSALLFPQAVEHYWFDGLFLNASRVGNVRYIGNQSLYGAIERLAGSATAARPYQLAAAAIVGAAGLALAAWASRRGDEMIGILTCAVTGLLVSPVSWSHHWVWVAPALVVLADLATRRLPGPAGRQLSRIGWVGIGVVLVVFSGVLWTVPASAVQGRTMTGSEQVVGDLYVLAGLVALGVIASVLALDQYRQRHRTTLSGTGPPLPVRLEPNG
jgi:alpha-1,2-mannosyltransferase